VRELLAATARDVTWLSGTSAGERDDAIVVALATFDGCPAVVVGSDRGVRDGAFGPAGLRTAQRAYALAAQWKRPLLTVVDTAGAEVSAAAEEGAMAGEIARSLAALSQLQTPIVSLLLGSGCGGGALALLPSDILLAASDAWITPLPPEGASAIVHRTTDRAAEFARSGQITAGELAEYGVIDALVGTPRPDPDHFLHAVGAAIAAALRAAGPSRRRVSRFVVAR
jgi:acetyl-CoA carboxylase carboxyl transferase subunit beta